MSSNTKSMSSKKNSRRLEVKYIWIRAIYQHDTRMVANLFDTIFIDHKEYRKVVEWRKRLDESYQNWNSTILYESFIETLSIGAQDFESDMKFVFVSFLKIEIDCCYRSKFFGKRYYGTFNYV